MEQHDQFNTAKEIADFSSTFVVSEELVKIYPDHLKHFHFSKDLQNQATVEKRRNREREKKKKKKKKKKKVKF